MEESSSWLTSASMVWPDSATSLKLAPRSMTMSAPMRREANAKAACTISSWAKLSGSEEKPENKRPPVEARPRRMSSWKRINTASTM